MKNLLLIPLAGLGRRFAEIGITEYKQHIKFSDGESPLIKSLNCFSNINDFEILFAVREKQQIKKISDDISSKFHTTRFVIVGPTNSPVDTINKALDTVDDSSYGQVIIHTMDISFGQKIKLITSGENFTYVFKAYKGPYSFVQYDENNIVKRCREKKPISDMANVGIYGIKNIKYLKEKISLENIHRNSFHNEVSIAEVLMNDHENQFKMIELSSVYLFGTPQEWEYTNRVSVPLQYLKHKKNRITLVSDYSGYEFISKLEQAFKSSGFATRMIKGSKTDQWSEVIKKNANLLYDAFHSSDDFICGSCSSGIGIADALSQTLGVYVPAVTCPSHMQFAIEHSASRCLSFASEFYKNEINDIPDLLNSYCFIGGRHQARQMENNNLDFDPNNNNKLDKFTGGWFVGQFEPSIFKDPNIEIGIKTYADGLDKPDGHYHSNGDELTIILDGEAKICNRKYKKNEYYIQRSLQPDLTLFSPGTRILVIRRKTGQVTKNYYEV